MASGFESSISGSVGSELPLNHSNNILIFIVTYNFQLCHSQMEVLQFALWTIMFIERVNTQSDDNNYNNTQHD